MNERKYRQRGYQDGSARSRPSQAEDASRRLDGAPRGRGADQQKELVITCKRCGAKVRGFTEGEAGTAFEAKCTSCQGDLHTCSHCRHFSPTSRFECLKEIPARVPDKMKANTCTLFSPLVAFDLTGPKAGSTPDQARTAFDQLFGKKP